MDRNNQRDQWFPTSPSDSTQSWSQVLNQSCKEVGGNTHKIRRIRQIITIHGGDADVLTKGSFSQERWTQSTLFFWIDDTPNTLLQPVCGICILSQPTYRSDQEVSAKSRPLRGLCLLMRNDGSQTKKEGGRNDGNPGDTAWGDRCDHIPHQTL